MARKKKEQLEKEVASVEVEEVAEAEADAITEMVDDSAELVDPTPHRPMRTKAEDRVPPTEEEIAAAQPKKFRVKRGGQILHRGNLTILREGKIIADNLYDIERLKLQGVLLEEEA